MTDTDKTSVPYNDPFRVAARVVIALNRKVLESLKDK
jgi:hypothetical protein